MNGTNHAITLDEKWRKIADDARNEARSMPPGEERDNLLKKARQLEVAAGLNSWLSSPELKAPQ